MKSMLYELRWGFYLSIIFAITGLSGLWSCVRIP